MKQTFYILKNNSGSDGTYLLNGEYKTIFPGERIDLKNRPTNMTSNITLSIYKKEVSDSPILNLKPKTIKVEQKKKSQ
jgi:hypothetical protein